MKNKDKKIIAQSEVSIQGLETANQAPMTKHVAGSAPAFDDRTWLENENPEDYHVEPNISSKYDSEREAKTQIGLEILKNPINGKNINPLIILLGRWWEVKPARAAIKRMIDAEAEAKGFTADVYLQVEIAKEIDALAELQTAIDRIRYAKTYFKPRKPLSNKVITKPLQIEGKVYNVSIQALEQARIDFAGDIDGLREYIKSIATQENQEVEEL